MNGEVLAIVWPIATIILVTSGIGYYLLNRRFNLTLALIDVRIQDAIDQVFSALGEIFEKPLVKGSMKVLSEKGHITQSNNALVNRMATDVLDGPKFAGIKLLAKQALNIDVDEYIEENGAVATLQAAQSLGQLVGIDITQALASGLNGANLAVGSEANGVNYYLGR